MKDLCTRYLKMRKNDEFEIPWFYEYYIENFGKARPTETSPNPKPLPFEYFVQAFTPFFQMNMNSILISLDKEFGVRYIEDKQGNFVKFM